MHFWLYKASDEQRARRDKKFAPQQLLLTEVSGLHAGANPVSGDFSLLARGFEVVNGEIQRAVEQFTVAGNFFALLMDVEAVGSDLLFEGSPIGSPSVAVKKLNIAGE